MAQIEISANTRQQRRRQRAPDERSMCSTARSATASTGAGDPPLKNKPTDLARLAATHNEQFPARKVRGTLDG